METRTVNYKNYVIHTEEGVKRGIFFRNPIQKVNYSTWEESKLSAWAYLHKIKNPLKKSFEKMLGNKKIIENIDKWSESCDWAGFHANILCVPVYFQRPYRRLKAISTGDDNISSIVSEGYESEFEDCSGHCTIEKTTISLRNGKNIRVKRINSYNYTYAYIVEKIIDSGTVA